MFKYFNIYQSIKSLLKKFAHCFSSAASAAAMGELVGFWTRRITNCNACIPTQTCNQLTPMRASYIALAMGICDASLHITYYEKTKKYWDRSKDILNTYLFLLSFFYFIRN